MVFCVQQCFCPQLPFHPELTANRLNAGIYSVSQKELGFTAFVVRVLNNVQTVVDDTTVRVCVTLIPVIRCCALGLPLRSSPTANWRLIALSGSRHNGSVARRSNHVNIVRVVGGWEGVVVSWWLICDVPEIVATLLHEATQTSTSCLARQPDIHSVNIRSVWIFKLTSLSGS